MKKLFLVLLLAFAGMLHSMACTSVIFSSRVTADGRPIMWKNRDTDSLDNRLEFFRGELYAFTALVNSSSAGGEAWAGSNVSGFSIMNTASYNLKNDNIPDSMMDREGKLMYRALEICSSLKDFEHFLDTCSRPLGVEAEFGVIDAGGGAAYYEVDNANWVKYDVNTVPEGYMVVTNFSFSGREEDRKGYERYITASAIFSEMTASPAPYEISPCDIFEGLSRSLRNEMLGIDYIRDYGLLKATGVFGGIVVDQDFIPRMSTSASFLIHGVRPGEDPRGTVIWTLLGYPFTVPAIPVPLCSDDVIPSYMKSSGLSMNARLCDLSLNLKNRYIFRFSGSNGDRYMDISLLADRDSGELLIDCVREAELSIRNEFNDLQSEWASGEMGYEEFIIRYTMLSETFVDIYIDKLYSFL